MEGMYRGCEEAVTEELGKTAYKLEPTGRCCWKFILMNDLRIRGEASLRDDWVMLRSPVQTNGRQRRMVDDTDVWKLACWNSELCGLAKFALSPGDLSFELRGEVPWDGGARTAGRIADTCDGFVQAAHLLQGKQWKRADEAEAESGKSEQDRAQQEDELWGYLEEAGWKVNVGGGGRRTISFDVEPGNFYQATMERKYGSGMRISTVLTRWQTPRHEHLEALGKLLLLASGVMRMVRGYAREEEGAHTELGFEVVFDRFPDAKEAEAGVSALWVACRLCGDEVEVLRDPAIAEAYLRAGRDIECEREKLHSNLQ